MGNDKIIDHIEAIINSTGYSRVDLDYLTKTTYFSIWDLVRVLRTWYNKFKRKYARFEWVRSLRNRIGDGAGAQIMSLVHEIEIQNLSNSDKAFLQCHFGFPMFNERAYKKNKLYRQKYDEKLLEFSESLNDLGVNEIAFQLLGMDYEEFERELFELETTISVITKAIQNLLDAKPHWKVLMKSQLRDICAECRRKQKRKAEREQKITQKKEREEWRRKNNIIQIKREEFCYIREEFTPRREFDNFRQYFNLSLVGNPLKDFFHIEKNNEKVLHFTVHGDVTPNERDELTDFLDSLNIFATPIPKRRLL